MRLQSKDTLHALIEQRGLSLSEMARRSGCSKSFISHLTSGRRSSCTPERAEAIAEVLAVPFDLLFVPTQSPADSEIITSRMTSVAS